MSTAEYDVMLALLAAGIAIVVLSFVSALTVQRVYNRLHFLTPATSVGAPLIGIALAIENGWGLTMAEDLFVVFLIALSGPALAAATGRLAAQREGLLEQDPPP